MLSREPRVQITMLAIVITLVAGFTMELRLAFLASGVLCLAGVALGQFETGYRVAVGPAEARVIYSPDPNYTEAARQRKIEGTVVCCG